MKNHIVLIGSLQDGYKTYGPFDSYNDAEKWCERNQISVLFNAIIPLNDPSSKNLKRKKK